MDQWQGIDVGFDINRPTSMWTFPIESVSQSEAGFELVHQSVVVQPHWWIRPNEEGNWTVTMRLMAAGDLDHPFGRQAVESLELAAV